jgi:hypothetical protein
MIERAPPELVKCAATTVIAQKTHEVTGLTWDEIKHRINRECAKEGREPAFNLPAQEVDPLVPEPAQNAPRKWRLTQNFAQLNKVTEITPMPQGDILAKQQ